MIKTRVMLAVLAGGGRVEASIAKMLYDAGNLSASPLHPFAYEPMIITHVRPVEHARNLVAAAFLESGCSRLYFVDDDMEAPDNWPALLRHDVPAATGLTFGWQSSAGGKRTAIPMCVLYGDDGKGGYISVPPQSVLAPYEVDACGAACLVVSRELVAQVGGPDGPWFVTVYGRLGEVELGEDCWFFKRANGLGHRVLVDPTVTFGHHKVMDVLDVARYGMTARRRGQDDRAQSLAS